MSEKTSFEFRAEMKQLLNLIIHSLYTHPEVFLRELVSNSSDALNKVRFRRLTDPNIADPELELNIKITADKEQGIFAIEDSGCGMTREDLVNQIGTIAQSGTLQFLSKLKEEQKSLDGNLIGQFGVGFYSVFMVTDEVTIETRAADPDSKSWRWNSRGEDSFTIEEIDARPRGTRISFKLKDEYQEFYEDYRIKSTIKKYSNFVDFPVFVGGEEVNKVTALWHRKKEDITDEELNEFYKFLTNDFSEPMGHVQLNIEGNLNFKGLLFIPKSAPPMMFRESHEKTLHLYSNKVFIQDDAKELLPDYLKFVKGVVDTEDLPLNVSREVTQNSPLMGKIRNVVTGKILSLLEEWAANDAEKYNTFFTNFGTMFKIGINSDFTHKQRILELLRFESSRTEPGKYTSLKDYVSLMQPEQKEIYYILGDSREKLERNPNLEYFKKQNIEVIFLTDPVDVFTIPYVHEYEGKQLKSIDKSDIDIPKDSAPTDSLAPEMSRSIIDAFKSALGDRVEDVVESQRLVSSPVTLVGSKNAPDAQMEKMMQILDKDFTASKKVLEVNMGHEIIKSLAKISLSDPSDPRIGRSALQLFESALLLDGQLRSPSDFVSRMNEILADELKK